MLSTFDTLVSDGEHGDLTKQSNTSVSSLYAYQTVYLRIFFWEKNEDSDTW